jgi:phosphate/sulfate permease
VLAWIVTLPICAILAAVIYPLLVYLTGKP